MTGVAAFDVDGTLTDRDCVVPFLQRLAGRRGIAAAGLRHPRELATALVRRDRDRIKELVVGGVFAGRSVADVDRVGQQFAELVRTQWMRPDTTDRLAWHRRVGHRRVLVSASLGPYLRPLGRMLGVDGVLCTDVVHDGVHYGDQLEGGNCRAAGKQWRLQAWLAEHDLQHAELWAYGDSRGDDEMLAMAHHPCRVGRESITASPHAGPAGRQP